MKNRKTSKPLVKMERWVLGIIIIVITITFLMGILLLFDSAK